MSNVTVTLGSLVDRTIFDLMQPGEQGKPVVMGSTALTTTSETTMTLTDATGVNVSDIIEFGDELVLVTAKSADTVPVLTVSRGYFNTTSEAHNANDVGHVNPPFPRRKIAEAVRRAFSRLEALGVPLLKSTTLNRETGAAWVQLPVDVREVLRVLYQGTDGRFWDLGQWEFHDSVPTNKASSGRVLNIGRYLADDDDLEITYRAPYRWSTHPSEPVDSSTIDIPEGAEDLPALYAAAWLLSSREISRSEIDRSEEWNRTEQADRGSSSTLIRARWQEFYRALDEARRLNQVPTPIMYKPMPRF